MPESTVGIEGRDVRGLRERQGQRAECGIVHQCDYTQPKIMDPIMITNMCKRTRTGSTTHRQSTILSAFN
jgi:hypothetical protein